MIWELSFKSFTLHTVNLAIQLYPRWPLTSLSLYMVYLCKPSFLFIAPWKLCSPTLPGLWPHSSQTILAPSLPNSIPLTMYFSAQAHFIPSIFLLYSLPLSLMTEPMVVHFLMFPPLVIDVIHCNVQRDYDNSKYKATWTRTKLGCRPSSLLTRSFLYPSATSSPVSSASKLKA